MTAPPQSRESDDELVTVARFANPMRAQLAKGMLQAAGVDCFLQGETANRMLSSAFRSRLRVLHADEADARSLLEGTGDLVTGDDPALSAGPQAPLRLPGRAAAATLFAGITGAPEPSHTLSSRPEPTDTVLSRPERSAVERPASDPSPAATTAGEASTSPQQTHQPRPRLVLCLSGGMDSAVCAALAARDHDVFALHCSYGQRTEARELQAARAVAAHIRAADFLHLRLDLFRRIGGSALTDPNIPVPEAPAEDSAIGAEIPVTYVPFRNAHFLSAAVSWAEVLGAQTISIGAVEQDSSGYPDCRPAYYEAFNQLISTGTRDGAIRVETPLIHLRKTEIVRLGVELGAPLHVSWSCYSGETEACGTCDSCVLRLRAFREAGIADPIPYARGTP